MSDGEARDEAQGEETVIEASEGSPEAEGEFQPFDEFAEEYQPGPSIFAVGADGVPLRVDQTSESDIPALSKTSLVCMGDFSTFVLRDPWGEIIVSLEPSEVQRSASGKWRAAVGAVLERAKLRIAQERKRYAELRSEHGAKLMNAGADLSDAQLLWGMLLPPGMHGALDPNWIEVQPVRPPCRFYVRQQGSFHLNAVVKAHYRLCSARRTTEGTFMTVRDTGMWACDMREPFDATSIKVLDDFDNMKIEQGAHREHLPIIQA